MKVQPATPEDAVRRPARPAVSGDLDVELALLGHEVQARAGEIAEEVLRWWAEHHPRAGRGSDALVNEDIMATARLGAFTLGRYLATRTLPSPEEREAMTAPGNAPIHDAITVGELVKVYLAWRDVASAKIVEWADRLGLSEPAVQRALSAARTGSDSSIVNVVRRFESAYRDLHQRLVREQELMAHCALHDDLTGLPNRALLVERLSELATGGRESGGRMAVLFFDIDGFKSVNDLAGHRAGDDLLVAAAERLRGVIRAGDTLARLGGDEFVILCPGLADPEREAAAVAERVNAVMAQPFVIGNPPQEFFLAASVGVGIASVGEDPESIVARADAAMYAVKRRGGSGYQIYDESVDRALRRRPELLNDLHGAVERGEMSLHYQPVVELATGKVVSLEALARWQHPRYGSVRPDEFIPLAEQSGAIFSLGRWVVGTAIRDCSCWTRRDRQGVGVSVNLSVRQLGDEGLPDFVGAMLEREGLDPSLVTLEISEAAVVSSEAATRRALETLKRTGVRLAIDDFGTGHSALAALRRLPVDVLKVDRSFMSSLGESVGAEEIVKAMVTLARRLEMAVVAEGVETPAELDLVRRLGYNEAQGFLLGRPAPI